MTKQHQCEPSLCSQQVSAVNVTLLRLVVMNTNEIIYLNLVRIKLIKMLLITN